MWQERRAPPTRQVPLCPTLTGRAPSSRPSISARSDASNPLGTWRSQRSGAVATGLRNVPPLATLVRAHVRRLQLAAGPRLPSVGRALRITASSAWASLSLPKPAAPAPGALPRGTSAMFVQVARAEGVGALWSGVLPTLLMAVPSTMMYFTAYDELKEAIQDAAPQGTAAHALAPLLAGGIARAGAATVVSPLELVRTKMQAPAAARLIAATASSAATSFRPGALARALAAAGREAGASMRQVLADEVRTGGVRSLWRGVGPTLLRDVPFSMMYWLGYESIRAAAEQRVGTDDVAGRFAVAFLAGAGSGSVAAVLTTPFDVAKTRVQIEMYKEARAAPGRRCAVPSTVGVLSRVVREEGPAALFSGLGARVAKVAPACAIMISSYEVCKLLLARSG